MMRKARKHPYNRPNCFNYNNLPWSDPKGSQGLCCDFNDAAPAAPRTMTSLSTICLSPVADNPVSNQSKFTMPGQAPVYVEQGLPGYPLNRCIMMTSTRPLTPIGSTGLTTPFS